MNPNTLMACTHCEATVFRKDIFYRLILKGVRHAPPEDCSEDEYVEECLHCGATECLEEAKE